MPLCLYLSLELVLLQRQMVLPPRELVPLPLGMVLQSREMVLLLPETARVQFHWQERPGSKQSRQQECWHRMWMLRSHRWP